ncbi:Asp-tRNA(Asn)/Glu-tRNA(Gln) amidotransferase subunit GatA [Nitrospira moscoviensis]|uniref:Glutamyl-tRNA(Gln) amidotransferase subunit A n=1 Tax=Nitrospira moscoviensis TaxID=42253 RepID=A0A0K2GG32_NITMO|nr:Asp-tRNA(Asn)/Glu-tRNA(Gln) amidotransferase subunit GatA [Nitrospira moscoviensis]ALA59824.1 Glutamyl-tRNA(Gln) amidotransferase subunit A [Nitrospira moscoviensis]
MSLHKLSLCELQKKFTAGEVTATEIVRAYALRIGQVEPKVKAYVTQVRDSALAQAEALDRKLKGWRKTQPMTGMPLALKDNLCTEGVPTTCSSRMLQHFVPPYDATVVARLRQQDYLLLGKTNLDEFAMGSSTENSAFGPSRNPWNLHCVPGGSSGGSAAAVAADECVAALGSDTGGSIRQPAAFCGVVGLKPTYGRVSRYGLVAFASSLDQIGPITKDVSDAAFLLGAIAGHDPLDSTSADVPVPDYMKALKKKDVKKLKIGMPREFFAEGVDPDVEQAVLAAVDELKALGGEIKEIQLPTTDAAVAVYYVLATAEASSNLARYDGVKFGLRAKETKDLLELYMKTRQEGFGPEVKRRIMLGTYALSSGYYDAYYGKAQAVRTLICQDFAAAFRDVDLIVTPVTPTPAFKLGEKSDDPLQMYLSDIFTISVNLAGLPAIALPCGFSTTNLPIGLQIIGRAFEEDTLLRAAHAYEQATQWYLKKPTVR